MTLTYLKDRLKAMGFEDQGEGAYKVTTRFDHPTVRGGSVFVGDGSEVRYRRTTPLGGAGPFVITNGRSRPNGMTQQQLTLGVPPTGRIPDPDPDDQVEDDDRYWRGVALQCLLAAMERRFRKEVR